MTFNNAANANTAGFQSITTGGVWNGRTLTPGTGISISHGDGTGGDPVITNTMAGGSGAIVQQVRTRNSTANSTSTVLADTGVTPTTGNTAAFISLTIQPTNASNILLFNFSTSLYVGTQYSFHTFLNGTLVGSYACRAGTDFDTVTVSDYVVAGTTSSVTAEVRWAVIGSTGYALQTSTGFTMYNGTGVSLLTVTEVTP